MDILDLLIWLAMGFFLFRRVGGRISREGDPRHPRREPIPGRDRPAGWPGLPTATPEPLSPEDGEAVSPEDGEATVPLIPVAVVESNASPRLLDQRQPAVVGSPREGRNKAGLAALLHRLPPAQAGILLAEIFSPPVSRRRAGADIPKNQALRAYRGDIGV